MVIDEIQRIPELLTVVHAVLEEPAPPRFVLTGSSARKLRRGGVDLLGGRAVHRTLHPSRDLRSLRAFREDWPEAETALLHRGRERLRIDGVWCLPVQDFLREMAPDRGLLAWL